MKNYRKLLGFTIFILITVIYIFAGCNTGSNSVATSISPPSLITPADRDTGVSLTPTFTWSGNADKFEIATNSSFSVNDHLYSVTGTQYHIPTGILVSRTLYFWRAGQTSGSTVYWSSHVFTFTTH